MGELADLHPAAGRGLQVHVRAKRVFLRGDGQERIADAHDPAGLGPERLDLRHDARLQAPLQRLDPPTRLFRRKPAQVPPEKLPKQPPAPRFVAARIVRHPVADLPVRAPGHAPRRDQLPIPLPTGLPVEGR